MFSTYPIIHFCCPCSGPSATFYYSLWPHSWTTTWSQSWCLDCKPTSFKSETISKMTMVVQTVWCCSMIPCLWCETVLTCWPAVLSDRGRGLLHPAGGRSQTHLPGLLQEARGLRQPRHCWYALRRPQRLRGRLPGRKQDAVNKYNSKEWSPHEDKMFLFFSSEVRRSKTIEVRLKRDV